MIAWVILSFQEIVVDSRIVAGRNLQVLGLVELQRETIVVG